MQIDRRRGFIVAHNGTGLAPIPIAKMNIRTGQFWGNWDHFETLRNYRDTLINDTINGVIDQMKKEFATGDLTAIDELLRNTPLEVLEGYLSE